MSTHALPGIPIVAVGADCDTSHGNVAFDSGGHPLMVAGLAQYYARIGRVLAAQRVLGTPGAGAGLGDCIGQEWTPRLQQDALSRAQATIESDALTLSIVDLSMTMPTLARIEVHALIALVGQPAGSPPLQIIWRIGA